MLLGLAALFILSFYVEHLRVLGSILLWLFIAVCCWDIIFLFYPKNRVEIERRYPDKLSNGDKNPLSLQVCSRYPVQIKIRILEELPVQLQLRNQEFKLFLLPNRPQEIDFALSPKQRGIYAFGFCNVLVAYLGLFERRFVLSQPQEIPCYPSFIQMRKYQLLATTDRLVELGVKRIRRIGSTLEFDHIRAYVRGDEYKHMNWRASAKNKKLMVNQFQEERSQPIYSFIDLGRVMRMPFNEMTLLDYAINASLVLSSAALLKQDRAGLLTFGKEVTNHIPAEKHNAQLKKISDNLYNITTAFEESEFGNLYAFARKHINKRALIFLYSNFETIAALNRQMPYLRMLNQSHIVVVIVFKNTELIDMAKEPAKKMIAIYSKIIAEKFVYEKQLLIQELTRNGLQTIYTAPEELSIQAINKYLEIKARGLI
ncbi:DUF58 domain-containing protein [Sphingobacterium sp. Mn56C]|uniref:DUF58 domain-containing protein n=1 Tax=Sphingobacterium sp. Mn56C TaxID=3395261 RepID=UPI003BEE7C4F